MKVIDYPDREMLEIDVANILAGDIENALLTRDTVTFVVPGGTTPGGVFDSLCAADLDWSRVIVALSDERWVPETSARSNAALIRTRLLTSRAADAHFVPYFVKDHSAQVGARLRAAEMETHLPIDVCLLGMGADMHTASLFPEAKGLGAALMPDAPAVMAIEAAGQEPRVSLSARVLEGAISKHLVIFGTDKRRALETATGNDPELAPIAAVMGGLTVHWAP